MSELIRGIILILCFFGIIIFSFMGSPLMLACMAVGWLITKEYNYE